MAVIKTNRYADIAFQNANKDMYGSSIDVVNLLSQQGSVLEDAELIECNRGDKHIVSMVSGLPEVAWHGYYEGVQPTAGKRIFTTDSLAMAETVSQIDVNILKGAKNPAKERADEAELHIESLGQSVIGGFFYGDPKNKPSEIMGLSPRFSDLNSATTGGQIVNAGGSGDTNTSLWFVTWGQKQTGLLYPYDNKSLAGISHEDNGRVQAFEADNKSFYVMEDRFKWHAGLTLGDYRYVVRIANIDAASVSSGDVDIYKFLSTAYYKHWGHRIPRGRTVIYCNTSICELIDDANINRGNGDNFVRLSPGEIEGRQIMSYRGIPIKVTDQLRNDESRVT